MATSQLEQFNNYVSVLESIDFKPTGISCSSLSASNYLADGVTSILEKCNVKYCDLVQTGCWPKAKPVSVSHTADSTTESTFVASSAPMPDSSFAEKLLESIPVFQLKSLLL